MWAFARFGKKCRRFYSKIEYTAGTIKAHFLMKPYGASKSEFTLGLCETEGQTSGRVPVLCDKRYHLDSFKVVVGIRKQRGRRF